MHQLTVGTINIDVELKEIKNIHLSVYPPNGRVKISAPQKMDLENIRVYAISKLRWIKKQQEQLKSQAREAPREYVSRESHYFLGKRYLLKLIEEDAKPKVILKHSVIELYVRPNSSTEKKKEVLDEWYRQQLKSTVPEIIEHWEKVIGVKCNEYGIKRMKTKWGTCNTEAKRIWLNLELARKPVECLEYIIVHELVHLLERSHNARFVALMDKFMPKWRFHKDELNRLPFSHVEWGY